MDTDRLTDGAVSGALTFAWYATADVVPSRGARALVKTGIGAAVVGVALLRARTLVAREDRADDGASGGSDEQGSGDGPAVRAPDGLDVVRALTDRPPVLDADKLGLDEHLRAGALARLARITATGAAGLAVGVAMTVAFERGVHRVGEHLGSRGVRAPHTLVGAVIGLATGVLAVVAPDADVSARGR